MKRYETPQSRTALAMEIAGEGIVLLKNENLLPLSPNKPVAIIGKGQIDTNIGGMGSGRSRSESITIILDEILKAGLPVHPGLVDFYRAALNPEIKQKDQADMFAQFKDLIASGAIYEIFGRYSAPEAELLLPDSLITDAKEWTDTAILVVTRSSGGEECDRRVEDDYYLLESEKIMIEQTAAAFPTVLVVLNIVGTIDTSWIKKYPSIKAVLYIGTPGEQGAAALAEIITGKRTPSGKLAATMALSYEDYPTASHFSYNKDKPETILTYENYGLDPIANGSKGFEKSPVVVYQEGIYVGYRYFDSFGKDVMYPFGFGLSYADFSIENVTTSLEGQELVIHADVINRSALYSGKETVQVYLSAPQSKWEQPYQRLVGFAKTVEIPVKGTAHVEIRIPVSEFTTYDETLASYMIEKGEYILRIGSSSRNTRVAAKIMANNDILSYKTVNVLPIQPANRGKIQFLSSKGIASFSYMGEAKEIADMPVFAVLSDENVIRYTTKNYALPESVSPLAGSTLQDVKRHRLSLYDFVSQMSDEELAVLANGYGPGLPFGGGGGTFPSTLQYPDGTDIAVNSHPTGHTGYISPALSKYGIPSANYLDGPAGVGITAWPTGTVLACTFNPDLLYAFGEAGGYEAEMRQVDSWLAPAMNIQRNPICGRNFEYFSEDPLLTGICALYMARGVEENNHVTVCPKHFALNEQETYRRGSLKKNYDAADSIVEERVAREIYLKPFEMLIRGTETRTIMSSFNKINGIFAAGNYDLCTRILREEWGFEGVVVTDWGDMDTVVDGADAVRAGNDVVMPGGPPVIAQVLAGLKDGRCSREDLYKAVSNLMLFVLHSKSFDK